MTNEQHTNPSGRRRRGRKPYPILSFERALALPKAIREFAVGRQIRRLTLFQQMERSPSSSSSHTLIAASSRYGLTIGTRTADYLELTDVGEALVTDGRVRSAEKIRMAFDHAIANTTAFHSVYERLKNERIPPPQVLQDLITQEDIAETDAEEASNVFVDNIRFVGLINEQSGNEYIIPLDQLLEELPAAVQSNSEEPLTESAEEIEVEPSIQPVAAPTVVPQPTVNQPALHIDIQIHVDSSASAEQIDQVFASMAKHLYGREG